MRISDWSSDVCSSDLYIFGLMTATDPVRNPDLRLGQLNALAGLLPYLWPAGRRALKARVAVALAFLVLAKLVTVVVPVVFRQACDGLKPAGAPHTAEGHGPRPPPGQERERRETGR